MPGGDRGSSPSAMYPARRQLWPRLQMKIVLKGISTLSMGLKTIVG